LLPDSFRVQVMGLYGRLDLECDNRQVSGRNLGKMFNHKLRLASIALLMAFALDGAHGLAARVPAAAGSPPQVANIHSIQVKSKLVERQTVIPRPPADEIQVRPWKGKIKHWAVEELPLPRDRTDFGIGEEVEFWIDPPGAEGPNVLVVWHPEGEGTVYPVVGPRIIATLDLTDKEGSFTVKADLHAVGQKADVKVQPSAAKLIIWARNEVESLPRGNSGPIGAVPREAQPCSEQIRNGLRLIDDMRKGKATAFKELDALGENVLKLCSDQHERGQVYYQLAHVHAQSGLVHPESVVKYAKRALECPLEPGQVPRLYVYWGDAQQVSRAHESATSRRRAAALAYLAGLSDVLRYPVPAKAPNLPGVDKGDNEHHEQQMAARRLAEFQVAMVHHRDTLVRQLKSLYPKDSDASDEIRILASAVLSNARAEERLLGVLQGKAWDN